MVAMLRTRLAGLAHFPRGQVSLPPAHSPARLRFRPHNDLVFWRRRALVLALPAVVVIGATTVLPAAIRALRSGVTLEVVGAGGPLRQGAVVNGDGLAAMRFRAAGSPAGRSEGVDVAMDGRRFPVPGGVPALPWGVPAGLVDGRHSVTVSRARPLLLPAARRSFTFILDTAAPRLSVSPSATRAGIRDAVTFTGTVEPGAQVTAGGGPVPVNAGTFEMRYEAPPAGPLRFAATDAAGNSTVAEIAVAVALPPTRAVHVSGFAWATRSLREPILALIDRGLIDAVQLDLKEEDGYIGYRSELAYPRSIGAVRGTYDLRAAAAELHKRNVRVIGRLVAFRDPVLAGAEWQSGRRERVVQTPDGQPYAGYGGFTNFANPDVQRYNIDIAEEAAAMGVDDVLYDYVRRPDGAIGTMRFPGLEGSPEDAIAGFLGATRSVLRPLHTYVGASVFGIAATRPTEIAQDIAKIAANADYIAPMVYPSHWNKGEYGVADPNRSPYEIVLRSLRDFQRQVAGTEVRLVPWLQDFALGVPYGVNEVRAQIQAAKDAGISDWILWDPAVTYTDGALPAPAVPPPG